MSKPKLGGDQKRKAERKAARAAAKAVDTQMTDASAVEVKKEKKERRGKKKAAEEQQEAANDVEQKGKKDRKAKKEEKRVKKEGNEEKEVPRPKKSSPSNDDDADSPSRKRKRSTTSDLEIDITLPQPPSKKALRKLKKHPELAPKLLKPTPNSTVVDKSTFPEHSSQARSKHGIWIGNLAFSTTPDSLRAFLTPAAATEEEITRVHLPQDSNGRNKGFAYIDFSTTEAVARAVVLSESLLGGRKVLIKPSNDFSNRPKPGSTPAAPTTRPGANLDKNPPSRILYCGNLDFSTTPESLQEHFSFAGKIQRVRLATFEDSGKCKGFGFVDFSDQECVRRAMLGLSPDDEKVLDTIEGKEEVELAAKRRKRGMLLGRAVTMEYGQDPSVRYKKRFGGKERVEAEGKLKGDTRSADQGAAYSADPRRSGAITAAEGKKMTFEE